MYAIIPAKAKAVGFERSFGNRQQELARLEVEPRGLQSVAVVSDRPCRIRPGRDQRPSSVRQGQGRFQPLQLFAEKYVAVAAVVESAAGSFEFGLRAVRSSVGFDLHEHVALLAGCWPADRFV